MRKKEFHPTEGTILMLEQMKRCDLVQSGKYSETEVWEHPEEWTIRGNKKNLTGKGKANEITSK